MNFRKVPKVPPIWNFSENSSVLIASRVPKAQKMYLAPSDFHSLGIKKNLPILLERSFKDAKNITSANQNNKNIPILNKIQFSDSSEIIKIKRCFFYSQKVKLHSFFTFVQSFAIYIMEFVKHNIFIFTKEEYSLKALFIWQNSS